MNDADLEAALNEAWHKFLSAIKRNDTAAAKRYWNDLTNLHDQRTPEQRARALVLAGLNPDGTPRLEKIAGAPDA